MKIIICVKQVPEPGDIEVDIDKGTLISETGARMLNLFDTHAIEEALKLKDLHDAYLVALHLSEEEEVDVVKEALAYGIDEGVVVYDEDYEEVSLNCAGFMLSKAILKIGDADLILTGKESTDYGSGRIAGLIGQQLNIPWFTNVKSLDVLPNNRIQVKMEWGEGVQVVETSLPAVVSVSGEINEPRAKTVKGIMRAKKMSIPIWDAGDIEVEEDSADMFRIVSEQRELLSPERKMPVQFLKGSPKEQVQEVIERINAILSPEEVK